MCRSTSTVTSNVGFKNFKQYSKNIECIFFVEFTSLGPSILFQFPTNYKISDRKAMEKWAIPSRKLHNKLFTLKYDNKTLIGYPTTVSDNTKYSRNTYTFNIVFLLNDNVFPFLYQKLVKKIVEELSTCEIEDNILSYTKLKNKIPKILEHVFCHLNTNGEVQVLITNSTNLSLKVIPNLLNTREIANSGVVPICRNGLFLKSVTFDQTITQILREMDGCRPLYRIAGDSNVSLRDIAYETVKHLKSSGMILGYTFCFQYQNSYLLTPIISLFLSDLSLQRSLLAYLKLDKGTRICIKIFNIIRFLLTLRHGQSLYDLYRLGDIPNLNFITNANIIRKILEFALLNGMIIKLKLYSYIGKENVSINYLTPKSGTLIDIEFHAWKEYITRTQLLSNLDDKNNIVHIFI